MASYYSSLDNPKLGMNPKKLRNTYSSTNAKISFLSLFSLKSKLIFCGNKDVPFNLLGSMSKTIHSS